MVAGTPVANWRAPDYDAVMQHRQRHRVVCSSSNNGGKLGNGFDGLGSC